MSSEEPLVFDSNKLLSAFQMYYHHYEDLVHEAISNPMDSTVLARQEDEINEYLTLVTEVRFSVPATINETESYLACPHLCS